MPNPKTPIRLIVADLDGTLLDSAHQIGPLTDQAVQAAIDQGVLFSVATGKTYPSTVDVIRRYDIRIPVISNNGTVLNAPDGTVLWEDPIPLDLALESIRLARKAGILPIVYAGPDLIAAPLNGDLEAIHRNARILMDHYEPPPRIVDDLERALQTDYHPHKIIFMKSEDLDAVARFQTMLEREFAGRADVMRSGLDALFEILPLGVSKANALDVLLARLGIAPDETMTLGDNSNDLAMIRLAGIGVAMGHAPEHVRAGADFVTGTNDEDGAGHAIRKFVLASSLADRR